MSFSITCVQLSLTKAHCNVVLSAQCQKRDISWRKGKICLDSFIGWYRDVGGTWHLKAGGTNFSQNYNLAKISLRGSVLHVGSHAFPLDLFIENQDGVLTWLGLRDDIDVTCTNFQLRFNTFLGAHVLGADGKLHYSMIDLDQYLGNEDGYFAMHKDSCFGTGDTFAITQIDGRAAFEGCLLDYERNFKQATFKFSEGFHSEGARIVDDAPVRLCDTRGPFSRFLEDIPILGLHVSRLDQIRGDVQESKHAYAVCVYHSIVFGATLIAGIFGGPVGAALGATLATAISVTVEAGVANLIVDDPNTRDELTTLTVWRFLKEEVVNTVGVAGNGIDTQISDTAIQLLSRTSLKESILGSISKGLEVLGGEEAAGIVAETLIDKVLDSLEQDRTPADVKARFGDKPNSAFALSHAFVNPPHSYGKIVDGAGLGASSANPLRPLTKIR